MTQIVELRSDTFTRPTEAMRRAMYDAEVGDDVWNEDPTVHRLEQTAAELMGKEAAVFVSSGTQGNLIAILCHTRPGNEVIVGDRSHTFEAEAAGAAVVGGVQLRPLANQPDGTLTPQQVSEAIRSDDIHEPPTGCIVLENTHNHCGGRAIGREAIDGVASVAHCAGIPLHIDGARIFNAAVALRQPAANLISSADSVTFCLSKGLGAPVGSLLCGSDEYIGKARRWRKLLGGGMRQVGILAAAGLVALDQQVDRLADDHANAKRLAEGLSTLPSLEVDHDDARTNIAFFTLDSWIDPASFIERLRERGVYLSASGRRVRAVTSYEVSRADIDRALTVISDIVRDAQPISA